MDERRTSRTARFIVYDVKTTFPWYILHRQERLTTLSLNGHPTGKLHRIFICVIIMWVRSSCLTFSKSSSTCYYVYIFLITCNCLLLSHNLHYFMSKNNRMREVTTMSWMGFFAITSCMVANVPNNCKSGSLAWTFLYNLALIK